MSVLPDPSPPTAWQTCRGTCMTGTRTCSHISSTLAQAEAWAFQHWNVASVGDREEIEANDYFYLLLARPDESGFQSRDYQARIIRQDRVIAIGREPHAEPRYPE